MRKQIVQILLFLLVISGLWANPVPFEEALDSFSQADYEQALLAFRDIILDDSLEEYHSESYFWIAKSYLAVGDLENAERNLEFYLLNFRGGESYQEAVYQKGRLLYLQDDYESCIVLLSGFLDIFPNSVFTPNALYWMGESLLSLGQLSEASLIFTEIVNSYPLSYKIEAAKYRISLIDLQIRERELLKLLKWSQEEFLSVQEEYAVKEASFQEAIAAYQQRLSSSLNQDSEQEIIDLNNTISIKNQRILELEDKTNEDQLIIRNLEDNIVSLRAQIETFQSILENISLGNSSSGTSSSNNVSQSEGNQTLEVLRVQAQELESFYTGWLAENGE